MDAIFPYIKSEQLFVCPSDSVNTPYQYYMNAAGATKAYGSYGLNVAYFNDTTVHNPEGKNLASIPDTAGTIFVLEHSGTSVTGPGMGWATIAGPGSTQPGISTSNGVPVLGRLMARHLETSNILFCDGHVKSQRVDSIAKIGTLGAYRQLTIEED